MPSSLANCPMGANSIVVSSLSQGDQQAISLCPTIRVNGLTVHVLPCSTSNAPGIVQYLIPALGIEAVGTGTNGEPVSGTGTDSVVGEKIPDASLGLGSPQAAIPTGRCPVPANGSSTAGAPPPTPDVHRQVDDEGHA